LMDLCLPARGTFGMSCGHLEVTIDATGRILTWRVWSSLEE
jgi:hypothetical protein